MIHKPISSLETSQSISPNKRFSALLLSLDLLSHANYKSIQTKPAKDSLLSNSMPQRKLKELLLSYTNKTSRDKYSKLTFSRSKMNAKTKLNKMKSSLICSFKTLMLQPQEIKSVTFSASLVKSTLAL